MAAAIDYSQPVVYQHFTGREGLLEDGAAELLWAACHGLVSLHSAERIPPDRIEAHIARIAQMWA